MYTILLDLIFNNCSIIPLFQVPKNRSGFQYAKHGNGYFGVGSASNQDNSISANEYISTTLKRPLKKNTPTVRRFMWHWRNGLPIVPSIEWERCLQKKYQHILLKTEY